MSITDLLGGEWGEFPRKLEAELGNGKRILGNPKSPDVHHMGTNLWDR